jgi:hypothetical protein
VNTVRAAHALAILLAFVLARRVPSSRQSTIAWALAALLAIDVALPPLAAWPEAYAAIWCAFYALTAWVVVVVLAKDETPTLSSVSARERVKLEGRGSPPSVQVGRPAGPVVRRLFRATMLEACPASDILPGRGRAASATLQVALVLAGLFVAATLAVYLGRTMDLERGAFVLSLALQLFAGLRAALFGTWPRREDLAAWLTAWVLICSSSVDAIAGAWAVAQPVRDWYISHWISGATWLLTGAVQLWILLRKPIES